jgi:hypothetical protein
MATTQTYLLSAAAVVAAGIGGAVTGAGFSARAGVPQPARAVVEFRAAPAAAATVETFVGNKTCAEITTQLDGCTPSTDLKEVTLRWPRDGAAANRIRGVAAYEQTGTWKRNGGSGVAQPARAVAEFTVGAAAAAQIENWLTARVCTAAAAQLGDCDVNSDVHEVTFRWDRSNVAQPLQVIVALVASGTWVRGAPQ